MVYLLQNEGTDKSTWNDVWGVLGIMAHLGRLAPGGTTMVEPIIRRAMQLRQMHLSLDFGDHLWMALFATLFHGTPVKLRFDRPLAVDVKEESGGAAEMAQISPTFGGSRRVSFREQDAMTHPTDAILVIEEFGGVGSLTEALSLLGISPVAIVYVDIDEKLRKHFKARHPDAICISDIAKITQEDIKQWRQCLPKVTTVLHGGGWPCQEQSKLNVDRQGLESQRGKLLEPMLRISQWLHAVHDWPGCRPWRVIEFYENVMFDVDDARLVREKIPWSPLHVKGEQFMYCRRPRQFWIRGLEIPWGMI